MIGVDTSISLYVIPDLAECSSYTFNARIVTFYIILRKIFKNVYIDINIVSKLIQKYVIEFNSILFYRFVS